MSKVISIHKYALKSGVDEAQFENAILKARGSGLLRLPGLVDYHFVKGIRGRDRGHYAALWVYESKEAWERLWGPLDHPHGKQDYPPNWKIWEDEVLVPFLDRDPDEIEFMAYEEF